MIIFLFGTNKYFIYKKIKEIIDQYKKKNPNNLNLLNLDAKDLVFQELKNKFKTASIFQEKKLFILRNLFKNQIIKEKFLKYIRESDLKKDKNNILVIFEIITGGKKEIDALKKDKFFLELRNPPVLFKEYKNLTPAQFKNWVFNFLKKENIYLKPNLFNFLLTLLPMDNLEISEKELEKLVLYIKSSSNLKNNLKKETLNLLISQNLLNYNIFQIIDALGNRNKKKMLVFINQLRKKGESDLYILAMMAFHIKNLIKIRALLEENKNRQEILKKLKMHPFVFEKLITQVSNFSLKELKKIYFLIFETDLNIKTGKTEPGLALDLLISKI